MTIFAVVENDLLAVAAAAAVFVVAPIALLTAGYGALVGSTDWLSAKLCLAVAVVCAALGALGVFVA